MADNSLFAGIGEGAYPTCEQFSNPTVDVTSTIEGKIHTHRFSWKSKLDEHGQNIFDLTLHSNAASAALGSSITQERINARCVYSLGDLKEPVETAISTSYGSEVASSVMEAVSEQSIHLQPWVDTRPIPIPGTEAQLQAARDGTGPRYTVG